MIEDVLTGIKEVVVDSILYKYYLRMIMDVDMDFILKRYENWDIVRDYESNILKYTATEEGEKRI